MRMVNQLFLIMLGNNRIKHMKPNVRLIFDNTESVHALAESMVDWNFIPEGNEKRLYNVGDEIVTNDSDTIKAGMVYTITDVMDNLNGYYNYYYGGMWHKQSAFSLITEKVFCVTVFNSAKTKKWHIETIMAKNIDQAITLAYALFGKLTNTIDYRDITERE